MSCESGTKSEAWKPKRVRQPPPICPVHGVAMRVRRTLPTMRYCYCPVSGCGESAKQCRESEREA